MLLGTLLVVIYSWFHLSRNSFYVDHQNGARVCDDLGHSYITQVYMSVAKGAVTHTITPVQRTKNEEFWSVRCDSLGVRQNSLMIWRERRINVIHLLCASTSAHIFCMFKNVSVFPRLNVYMYARRTSDQRQYNASRLVEIGAKYWPRVGSLPISIELIESHKTLTKVKYQYLYF